MADLMIGTVTVKGKKEDVLEMFEELWNYYDKCMILERGTDKNYEIEFEFISKLVVFLSEDYFLDYSKEYNCHIEARMFAEEDEELEEEMFLEYDKGKIIHGIAEYGL